MKLLLVLILGATGFFGFAVWKTVTDPARVAAWQREAQEKEEARAIRARSQVIQAGVKADVWNEVAEDLRLKGLTCRESSTSAGMRIVLTGAESQALSAYEARKLAKTVQERLGGTGVVVVEDDTGMVLAKATSTGVTQN